MNPLQSQLHSTITVPLYHQLHQLLALDSLIFEAMRDVARRRGFAFEVPTSSPENAKKHQEIEGLLDRYQTVLKRQGLFFDLVEEIYTQLKNQGLDVLADRVLNLVASGFKDGLGIRLIDDCSWGIEWQILGGTDAGPITRPVVVVVYKSDWGPVVPWQVVQYLSSGMSLYRQKNYSTALALLSIAVEATLRDILSTRGYVFNPSANKVDIYEYTVAKVNVSGNGYAVDFVDHLLEPAGNLAVAASGAVPIEIAIRREIHPSNKRVDLHIKAPRYLIDHWSTAQIEKAAQPKNIGGLGSALNIARVDEGLITSTDLPPDVDGVLKAVRNNLIHLSSDSMDNELPQYASLSPSGKFTVRDFVSNPGMVYDLVVEIPQFVNEQYVKLWRAGTKI